ncbi:hypothetical protein [Lacinutrix chionoecetis]
MKHILFILFNFCVFIGISQNKMFLNGETRLLKDSKPDSQILGYFKTNAQVSLISEATNGYILIKADNNDVGYVKIHFLTSKYTSNPQTLPDNENPILNADKYYGNSHLFVTAANLRARSKPNINGDIVGKLTTGQAVPVRYLPVDKESWVNISNGRFVQRKFLNERPGFDALVISYQSINLDNKKERLKIAERLVQLAWNTHSNYLKPAYEILYALALDIGDKKLIHESKLFLEYGKQQLKVKNHTEIEKFIENADFIIKNLTVKNQFVEFSELIKHYGEPNKTNIIGDECGVYYSETFYMYDNMTLTVNKDENKANVNYILLNNTNKFILNQNHIIDGNRSEIEFIKSYGSYVQSSINSLHTYTILNDYGGYTIKFKKGKAYSVSVFSLC